MKNIRRMFIGAAATAVLTALLSVGALAATGEATVNSHMLNVREGAGMEYTIIDVAYEGNTVNVTRDLGNGWVEVSFNGQTGYVNSLFLTFKPAAEQTVQAPAETAVEQPAATPAPQASTGSANGSIKGDGVYFRSGPSTGSSVIDTLSNGTRIVVNGVVGEWYEVGYNNSVGYVHGSYVVRDGEAAAAAQAPTAAAEPSAPAQANTAAADTAAQTPEATPAPTATPAPAAGTVTGQTIVDKAMSYQGVRYVWGGTSPSGFDCSGLIYYVYQQYGYKLNRVAQSMYYNGTAVDLNDLQPGDILLFGSSVYNIWHAGLYIGNGNFVHAPHSGAVVSTQSIAGTYGMRLVAARRIIG